MNATINMTDIINTQPFDGIDSQYRSIDDVIGANINILGTKFFTNDKGEGVFILCDDGVDVFHICTHSVGLVATLKNQQVQEYIEQKVPISAKIVKRKSITSDRMVYSFA